MVAFMWMPSRHQRPNNRSKDTNQGEHSNYFLWKGYKGWTCKGILIAWEKSEISQIHLQKLRSDLFFFLICIRPDQTARHRSTGSEEIQLARNEYDREKLHPVNSWVCLCFLWALYDMDMCNKITMILHLTHQVMKRMHQSLASSIFLISCWSVRTIKPRKMEVMPKNLFQEVELWHQVSTYSFWKKNPHFRFFSPPLLHNDGN